MSVENFSSVKIMKPSIHGASLHCSLWITFVSVQAHCSLCLQITFLSGQARSTAHSIL